MSNKKTLKEISSTEAARIGVSSLANRPNGTSRYGDGGMSAKDLKERFDRLPNFVKDNFNSIVKMLASKEAPKYITIGDIIIGNEDNPLSKCECLYDFLVLFGTRGDGVNDKNISDCIYVRYGTETKTLFETIAALENRIAELEGKHQGESDV